MKAPCPPVWSCTSSNDCNMCLFSSHPSWFYWDAAMTALFIPHSSQHLYSQFCNQPFPAFLSITSPFPCLRCLTFGTTSHSVSWRDIAQFKPSLKSLPSSLFSASEALSTGSKAKVPYSWNCTPPHQQLWHYQTHQFKHHKNSIPKKIQFPLGSCLISLSLLSPL